MDERHQSIIDAVERLEKELILWDPTEVQDKAFEFTHHIGNILSLFEEYHATAGDEDELSEEKLRSLIKSILIEMKARFTLNEN